MDAGGAVKEKRQSLGLTHKEFADALCLGKNGDRIIRSWENGEIIPSQAELEKVIHFAEQIPFENIPEDQATFRFIDLFAGIGGIRIPFQELGGRCVFSSEWEPHAQKTYEINFGEVPAGDITKIDANVIPDFDVLMGGFPCQPFSQAGRHKGFQDSRGTLFFEIERILETKRPKAFLLENVKQLVGHDKGNTLRVILDHLDRLNYHVNYKVLRAADYGVPQNRERIYIVGFDKNYYDIPANYSFPYPEPTHEETRLGDILESDVDERYTISDAMWIGHVERKKKHQEKGNGFGYSLFTPDAKYVNTISARYYKDGSEVLIDQGEGKNPRTLTPRECARLQGFPEKFIIPVSNSQAYKQFGNSVAVPVVRAVAAAIRHEMLSFHVKTLKDG